MEENDERIKALTDLSTCVFEYFSALQDADLEAADPDCDLDNYLVERLDRLGHKVEVAAVHVATLIAAQGYVFQDAAN